MRRACFWAIALLLGSINGELGLQYDAELEGRTGLYHVVAEVVGNSPGKTTPGLKKSAGNATTSDAQRRLAIGRVLDKRQYYCDDGYGYCDSADRCCAIDTTLCCSYGYCLWKDQTCCPGGACDNGQDCCGRRCMPAGSQCCKNDEHCEAGNNCYLWTPTNEIVCCTDAACTAHVESGRTTYATTSTTTRTYTTTSMQYYYWSTTWYYYYYYWTYIVDIEASVVTSTRSTVSITYSVSTTDAEAASQYFSSMSRTFKPSTPAAATSLASLAGSTSYETTSSRAPNPIPSSNGGMTSSTTAADGNATGGSNTILPGSQDSMAMTLSLVARPVLYWCFFGTAIGVAAIWL